MISKCCSQPVFYERDRPICEKCRITCKPIAEPTASPATTPTPSQQPGYPYDPYGYPCASRNYGWRLTSGDVTCAARPGVICVGDTSDFTYTVSSEVIECD